MLSTRGRRPHSGRTNPRLAPKIPAASGDASKGIRSSPAVNTTDSRGQHAFSFFHFFQGLRRRLFWISIRESVETENACKSRAGRRAGGVGGDPIAWDSRITPGVGVFLGNAHSHDKLTGFVGNLCSSPPRGRKGMSQVRKREREGGGEPGEPERRATRPAPRRGHVVRAAMTATEAAVRAALGRRLRVLRPRRNAPFLSPVLATFPQSLIVSCTLFS